MGKKVYPGNVVLRLQPYKIGIYLDIWLTLSIVRAAITAHGASLGLRKMSNSAKVMNGGL